MMMLIFLVLHFTNSCFATSTNKFEVVPGTNYTCEQLSTEHLLAIVQHRQQVLFITSASGRLYHVDASRLTSTSLNLSETSYSELTMEKGLLPSSSIFILVGHNDGLYFIRNDFSGDGTISTVFDLYNQTRQSSVSHPRWSSPILISTSEPLHFYAILRNVKKDHHHLEIGRLKMNGDSLKSSTAIVLVTPFYPLCAVPGNSSAVEVLEQPEEQCSEQLTWPSAMTGTAAPSGIIYLFSEDHVVTFPEAAFTNRGSVQLCNRTSKKKFVVCSSDQDGSDVITVSIAIGLVVLIIVLSCLLCCFQEGLGIRGRLNRQRERRRQQRYQACLTQKTYAISPLHKGQFNSPHLKAKSDDMGTQLFVEEPLVKGNAGILVKVHSSESFTRTKRVFSHLSLGIEKTFRKDFGIVSKSNLR